MLLRAAALLMMPIALAAAQTSDDSAPGFKGHIAEPKVDTGARSVICLTRVRYGSVRWIRALTG
jgi:hypothetical protein